MAENTSNMIASRVFGNEEGIEEEHTRELKILELRSAKLEVEQRELDLEERKIALLERKRALGM